MVLLSSVRIYGIEDGVGVDMLFIHVDADDGLVPRQMLCGEFFGDLQRQFRRNVAAWFSAYGSRHIPWSIPDWLSVSARLFCLH